MFYLFLKLYTQILMRCDILGATVYQSPYFLGRSEISFHMSSEAVIKKDQKCVFGAVCFSAMFLFNCFILG